MVVATRKRSAVASRRRASARGARDPEDMVTSRAGLMAPILAVAACWTSAAAQTTQATCPDDESGDGPWELGPSGGCYKVVKAGMYSRLSYSTCAEVSKDLGTDLHSCDIV